MKQYKIVIDVKYVESTVPSDMSAQLYDNIVRCIENAELLDDINLEIQVEEYDVKVEDL